MSGRPLNVLISYAAIPVVLPILEKLKILESGEWRFFLDSGAFTNFSTKKNIVNLDDYCAFIKSGVFQAWNYINLDVIGDHEASEINHQEMKSRGLKPVPVFQRGDGTPTQREQELLRLLDENEVVCIGGVAGRLNRKEDVEYLFDCVNVGRKRPKTKIHILGCSSISVLEKALVYSADSSSCSSGGRFKSMSLWHRGTSIVISSPLMKRKENINRLESLFIRDCFRAYGILESEINNPHWWSEKKRNAEYSRVEKQSYIRRAQYLYERFNTHLFLALYLAEDIYTAWRAWQHERVRWGW